MIKTRSSGQWPKQPAPAQPVIDWREAWITLRRDVYLAEGYQGVSEALSRARAEADRLDAWVAAGGGRLEMAYKLKPNDRCTACDGTGDVHNAAGEWLGACVHQDGSEA